MNQEIVPVKAKLTKKILGQIDTKVKLFEYLTVRRKYHSTIKFILFSQL
jgi:hypothetical protein